MKGGFAGLLIIFVSGLAACSDGAVDCSSEQATATVLPILKEQVERQTVDLVRDEDGGRAASNSEIRAALGRAEFAIDKIRTASRDPNSTKRFCSGTLRITFPAEIISSAETSRQLTNQDDVESLADRNDMDRSANRFETEIEYSVQPTDDGRELFAEVKEAGNVFNFAAELLASHLVNNEVRQARAEQEAELARQRQAEVQQQQEQQAALVEQDAATLAQARNDLKLAEQLINTIWQNIPQGTRQALLEEQRGWIRMKSADCRVEAASASIDPREREVTRVRCEARLNRDRSNFLRRYVGVESDTTGM